MMLYAAEGMQDIDIASRLDCHPEVVSKWRRRFCEDRLEGLQDKQRAGRPRRFPPEQVAFAPKAGWALDLYQRRFECRRLRPDEYVICADEKSQLQALGRRHETMPPAAGRPVRFEFEYHRNGTLAYLGAWDVHHANLFDRVEPRPESSRSVASSSRS